MYTPASQWSMMSSSSLASPKLSVIFWPRPAGHSTVLAVCRQWWLLCSSTCRSQCSLCCVQILMSAVKKWKGLLWSNIRWARRNLQCVPMLMNAVHKSLMIAVCVLWRLLCAYLYGCCVHMLMIAMFWHMLQSRHVVSRWQAAGVSQLCFCCKAVWQAKACSVVRASCSSTTLAACGQSWVAHDHSSF